MKDRQYNAVIFIGRFQPFHNGHEQVLNEALNLGDRVIVVLGSSQSGPSTRNPFSAVTRERMIRSCYSKDDNNRISFVHASDDPYNDRDWVERIESACFKIYSFPWQPDPRDIAVIGHKKDESSYYLDLFRYDRIDYTSPVLVNATDIRDAWFKGKHWFVSDLVSSSVYDIMSQYTFTADYERLCVEYAALRSYKQKWNPTGSIVAHTADAFVTDGNNVVLIERNSDIGNGLLALPGGFVEPYERLIDAMTRELREETGVTIPNLAIGEPRTFDYPYRSERGRIITTVFPVRVGDLHREFQFVAGDDASSVQIVNLDVIEYGKLFEDHGFIIKEMRK